MFKSLSKLYIRTAAKIWLLHHGGNIRIGYSSHIKGFRNISIGKNFFSGPHLYLNTNNISNIFIGNDVMFGPFVKVISGNHVIDYKYGPINSSPHKKLGDDRGIKIDDDVWIGASTLVLDGAHICEGVVIGAGSVVTRKIPPYTIAVGNPAKVIKARFSAEDLSSLLTNKSSKLSMDSVVSIYEEMGIKFKA
ncbi:acyltransferase [Pseudomonas nicosulfuronedens]